MSAAVEKKLMTTEEFLALPANGMSRWLIDGELREFGRITVGIDPLHAVIIARLVHLLDDWLDTQPEPRGEVHGGEAVCLLKRNPDTTVGIDVAYLPAETESRWEKVAIIDGVPILAVDVLSPHDTPKGIHDKTATFLRFGVKLVWVVDPYDRTVRVYRPGAEPESFNVIQELSADPHLPGFKVRVASIFSRR